MNDEVRAKTLPAWKEWFNANIVREVSAPGTFALLAPSLVALAVFALALGALLELSVVRVHSRVGPHGRGHHGQLPRRAGRASRPAHHRHARAERVHHHRHAGRLVPGGHMRWRARPSPRWRSILLVLTLAPFFTGAIVRTYAWTIILGNSIVRWPVKLLFEPSGVLIGLVHFAMPTMILILAAALSHVDPGCERAAASLGARPWRVFWRVTLPLPCRAWVSGSLIVFAWTFSAFPTPSCWGADASR
jgi:ABC-type proline/glycine betaine transport system permease subunit